MSRQGPHPRVLRARHDALERMLSRRVGDPVERLPSPVLLLTRVAEVVGRSAAELELRAPASRDQHVNAKPGSPPRAPAHESGRRILLRAQVRWSRGEGALAGHEVLWELLHEPSDPSADAREGPTFDEPPPRGQRPPEKKRTTTDADGWTPPLMIYLPLAEGDLVRVVATLGAQSAWGGAYLSRLGPRP